MFPPPSVGPLQAELALKNALRTSRYPKTLAGRVAMSESSPCELSLWQQADPSLSISRSYGAPQAQQKTRDALQKILQDYRIEAQVVGFRRGLRLELYELSLPKGFKCKRLVALAKDLARSMASPSLRVLESIPGTSHVGIEVARPPELWKVRALEDWLQLKSPSPFRFLLGELPWGGGAWGDLLSLPHLLVAGATGSGKTNFLKGMLCHWMVQASPEELQWILMDFKWFELSDFERAPHLRMPIIREVHQAVEALELILLEMERRFEQLQKQSNPGSLPPFPRWVVVMDEFADLILLSPQIEKKVIRLAQKGRAAGIHLVLSTQRPSREVVTGLLKANFLHRMAFKVQSQVDSRVILDQPGAEQLLGAGDLLYASPNGPLQRLHAAYLSRASLESAKQRTESFQPLPWLSLSAAPSYAAELSAPIHSDAQLFKQTLLFLMQHRQISITQLQRQFKVGYNRAARMVDYLEGQGVISASERGGPRLLKSPYDRFEGTLEVWLNALRPLKAG